MQAVDNGMKKILILYFASMSHDPCLLLQRSVKLRLCSRVTDGSVKGKDSL